MGCAASKLDIEADRQALSGIRPICIKKCRRRRLRRFNTFSATSELLQFEESENTGDTSSSGKVKASAVAPEPIVEEEPEDRDREELISKEVLEMKKVPTEKKEDPKVMIEELKEKTVQVSKNKLEERNQERDELTDNQEESKDTKGETSQKVAEEMKEKINEESKDEGEESVCIQLRTEELRENMEKKNQGRTEEMKAKEDEKSQQMTTEEPKKSTEEITTKNENIQEKNEEQEQDYDPSLISNRITEGEEVFQGSPSFRFYCRNIQSFDSEDSITLSGFHQSNDASVAAAERLEEIKQNNEPIEEVSESQASSKGFERISPQKRKGRRLLKLKAPNAVRSLFTCYSAGNSCNASSSSSSRYRNPHLIGNSSN